MEKSIVTIEKSSKTTEKSMKNRRTNWLKPGKTDEQRKWES